MDIKKLKINTGKAEEGVWVDFGDGFKVKVARKGNKDYQKHVTNHPKIKPFLKNPKAISDDVFLEVVNEAKAKFVVRDWSGLKDGDKEVPYTWEKALEMLTDPELAEFVGDLEAISDSYETFRDEEIEVVTKK